MSVQLPQALKTILEDKAYGHVITFNAKGQPQMTMVWMDHDGNDLLINTAEGRQKPKNLRRDPRVIVSVQDRNNPQSYAIFYGKATRITEDGARDHINKMAKRFLGMDKYPGPPTETRLLVHVDVDRVAGSAPGYKPWV
jgi:PPOX class probable F420-dependent enzyme